KRIRGRRRAPRRIHDVSAVVTSYFSRSVSHLARHSAETYFSFSADGARSHLNRHALLRAVRGLAYRAASSVRTVLEARHHALARQACVSKNVQLPPHASLASELQLSDRRLLGRGDVGL